MAIFSYGSGPMGAGGTAKPRIGVSTGQTARGRGSAGPGLIGGRMGGSKVPRNAALKQTIGPKVFNKGA